MQEKNGNNIISLDAVRSKRKLNQKEFVTLPVADKKALLHDLPAGTQLKLIIADPAAQELVSSFQPQELYWLIKEVGESDGATLLPLASPEQAGFILDMELWGTDSFSQEKAIEWLGYLVAAGERTVTEQVRQLDLELLVLLLKKELFVGGGMGDLLSDEERLGDWDHTFDNCFMLSFRDPANSQLIAQFIEIIHRNDQALYLTLMEGVKNEVEVELEELEYGFRSGRLADLGFPERHEALAIYAPLDPAGFTVTSESKQPVIGETSALPARLLEDDSLLRRALKRADSKQLRLELNYLVNNALVADEAPFSDPEVMNSIFQRICGYLNIALEHLSGGDEAEAVRVLEHEYLKRLFQLGHGIVHSLKKTATTLESDNYATNKALLGLRAIRPRFYRALDPDGVDGYREFRDLADVHKTAEFLQTIQRG